MMRFQANAAPATQVARIDLHAWLRGANAHSAARAGITQFGIAINQERVVDTRRPDGAPFAEVHRASFHRGNFAGGDERLVHRQVARGLEP